jgi:hypothetical protein
MYLRAGCVCLVVLAKSQKKLAEKLDAGHNIWAKYPVIL